VPAQTRSIQQTASENVPIAEEEQEKYMATGGVQIQRERRGTRSLITTSPIPPQQKKSFWSFIKNPFSKKKSSPAPAQAQDSQEPLLPTRKALSTKTKPKRHTRKIVIISLIIIITLIMILALLAGLFWDRFF